MLVQYLIEKGSHLSHKGVGGVDALHLAVRAGNVQIAFLLLSAGSYVDSQDECNDTPFHWCLKVRNFSNLQEIVLSSYCIL